LPSELSEMQDISRNTVSALINGLEAEDLVMRAPHASDRRKRMICLTPKGRALLNAQLSQHLEAVSQSFNVFNRDERDTLISLLVRLTSYLKESAPA